jgi:hypothetical protein
MRYRRARNHQRAPHPAAALPPTHRPRLPRDLTSLASCRAQGISRNIERITKESEGRNVRALRRTNKATNKQIQDLKGDLNKQLDDIKASVQRSADHLRDEKSVKAP